MSYKMFIKRSESDIVVELTEVETNRTVRYECVYDENMDFCAAIKDFFGIQLGGANIIEVHKDIGSIEILLSLLDDVNKPAIIVTNNDFLYINITDRIRLANYITKSNVYATRNIGNFFERFMEKIKG